MPPPHVGRVREEASGIEVKGVREEGDPPSSSFPGTTPFCPTNSNALEGFVGAFFSSFMDVCMLVSSLSVVVLEELPY